MLWSSDTDLQIWRVKVNAEGQVPLMDFFVADFDPRYQSGIRCENSRFRRQNYLQVRLTML